MTMNQKWIRGIRIGTGILLLFWMLLIGSFSAQQGEESAGLSRRAAGVLVSAENRLLQRNWNEDEKDQRIKALQFPVRKCAHMSEYALYAMLLVLHLSCYAISWKHRNISAWLLALAYASTDEIHQLFVPGRSGQLTDVMIDAAGALLGLLFLCLCRQLILKRKRNSPGPDLQ